MWDWSCPPHRLRAPTRYRDCTRGIDYISILSPRLPEMTHLVKDDKSCTGEYHTRRRKQCRHDLSSNLSDGTKGPRQQTACMIAVDGFVAQGAGSALLCCFEFWHFNIILQIPSRKPQAEIVRNFLEREAKKKTRSETTVKTSKTCLGAFSIGRRWKKLRYEMFKSLCVWPTWKGITKQPTPLFLYGKLNRKREM